MRKQILFDIIAMLKNCDDRQLCYIRGFARGVTGNSEHASHLSDEDLDLIMLFVNTYIGRKAAHSTPQEG